MGSRISSNWTNHITAEQVAISNFYQNLGMKTKWCSWKIRDIRLKNSGTDKQGKDKKTTDSYFYLPPHIYRKTYTGSPLLWILVCLPELCANVSIWTNQCMSEHSMMTKDSATDFTHFTAMWNSTDMYKVFYKKCERHMAYLRIWGAHAQNKASIYAIFLLFHSCKKWLR